MYLIYNIHSKTLSITPRSLHKTYKEATESLKKQVEKYVTETKAQSGFTVVHSYEEIENSKETGYFLLFSEEYNNRISIYEKRVIPHHGWVYSGHEYKILESTTFSLMDLPILDDDDTESSVANDMDFVATMRQTQKNMAHGSHVDVIEELKTVLAKRGKIQA